MAARGGDRVAPRPATANRMTSTTRAAAIRIRKTWNTNRAAKFRNDRCIVLPLGRESSTDNTGTESESAYR